MPDGDHGVPPWRACARSSRDDRRARAPGTCCAQQAAQFRNIGRGAGRDPDHDQPRHRQFVEREPAAEPGLQQLARFLLAVGPHRGDAGKIARHRDAAFAPPRRGRGRRAGTIWMVTSRATSDCHSLAAEPTSMHRAGGERDQEGHDRDHRDQRAAGDGLARHQRRLEARQHGARRARRRPQFGGGRFPSSSALNRRCAAGRRAAPAGAHRIGPSARCRGWRSPPRCPTC